MELKTLEQEDKQLKLEVVGEDDTILNLIKEELLEDDDVVVATYNRRHPQLDNPHIKVEVNKGDPAKKLRDVVKSLRKEFDELETDFLDATK